MKRYVVGWTKASKITVEEYLTSKYNKNSSITPSSSNVVYIQIADKIKLLPEGTYDYHIIARSSVDTFKDITEINIPTQYVDLLLTLAALEGMQDLAAQDKVAIYQGELNYHLQTLAGYAQILEQREGRSIRGD